MSLAPAATPRLHLRLPQCRACCFPLHDVHEGRQQIVVSAGLSPENPRASGLLRLAENTALLEPSLSHCGRQRVFRGLRTPRRRYERLGGEHPVTLDLWSIFGSRRPAGARPSVKLLIYLARPTGLEPVLPP